METCKGIIDLDVHEEDPVGDKVVKLDLAVNKKNDTISTVQFKYELQISELQMKLQPTTLQEVRDQREID